MYTKRSGMSVWLFSFIWLAVTIGTVLLMINGREGAQKELQDTRSDGSVKANLPGRHMNRDLWGNAPFMFEGVTPGNHRGYEGANNNATLDESDLPQDALLLMENLCNSLCEGGVDNIKTVFPPGYVELLIDEYVPLASAIGGEDAVIEYVLKLKLDSIIRETGDIERIDYEIIEVNKLKEQTLIELTDTFEGLNLKIEEAYSVKLKLFIRGQKSTMEKTNTITVLRSNDEWYISPEGLMQ